MWGGHLLFLWVSSEWEERRDTVIEWELFFVAPLGGAGFWYLGFG